MKIIIAGGGTGGHVYPGLAIIEELRRRDQLLLVQWVGKKNSLEEKVCSQNGIPFRSIPIIGWPRTGYISKLNMLIALALSIIRSYQIIRRFQPQIVVGVGGYASFPPVWCAQKLGIPTVLHEQNSKMGLANKMLAKNADRVFLSFPLLDEQKEKTDPSNDANKYILTGNPVRLAFVNPPDKKEAREKLGLKQDLFTVLFMGGSQGARSINQSVKEILSLIEPYELQIVWLTGKGEYEQYSTLNSNSKTVLKILPYSDEMATLMASADLIVSRAGASTLAEITAIGRASILIPYPYATDNHQEFNAKMIESSGAGDIILESQLNASTLLEKIRNYIKNSQILEDKARNAKKIGKPLAGEVIAEEILKLLFGQPQESTIR